MPDKLTHLDEKGEARMVDVSEKAVTRRRAEARGRITMAAETLALIRENGLPKGDVLAAARLAGIMAAKKTGDLIPLCHPLPLEQVTVQFTFDDGDPAVEITASATVTGRTGIEMEALTAVSVAALTLYDMCKAVDKAMRIGNIRLTYKEGGRSGVFRGTDRVSLPPLMPVDDALGRVLATFSPVDHEQVPLRDALGRVLAEPVTARTTNPPFSASAMDGYGARAADLAGARPVTLKVVGEAGAGHPFAGQVNPGECVRIFTGAPLPAGADCVVMQENTERDEGAAQVRIVTDDAVPEGRFVRPAGRDFSEGDTFLPPGTFIGPQDIALLGAADVATVTVRRRPRVAIISNGDELEEPGTPRKSGQIPASNAIALKALIDAHGGAADDLGIARDSVDSLQAVARRALGYDLVVTIGGASVGDRDLVQSALAPMGLAVDFWRVAMRPGKPLIFGHLGDTPMIGLPGNPVSSLVCGFLFVLPALRAMLGMDAAAPARATAILDADVAKNGPRQAYLRATLRIDENGRLLATPLGEQDSAYLAPLAGSDALVIRPPHAPATAAGERTEIHILRAPGGVL